MKSIKRTLFFLCLSNMFSITVSAQIMEVEGELKVTQMQNVLEASQIVVRLEDGTMASIDQSNIESNPTNSIVMSATKNDTSLLNKGFELFGTTILDFSPVDTSATVYGEWRKMTDVNRPQVIFSTSTWDGNNFLVYGQSLLDQENSIGKKYQPDLDVWEDISVINAPTKRVLSVWIGTDWVITSADNTSAKYNPISDIWTDISEENSYSYSGNAIWTGAELFCWSGNQQKLYNPSTDIWTDIDMENGPSNPAYAFLEVVGDYVIVFGNEGNRGRYNYITGDWEEISNENAPEFNYAYQVTGAIGDTMIVYSSYDQSKNGIYDLVTDSWSQMNIENPPIIKYNTKSVSTETGIITLSYLLGSDAGGIYNLEEDSWFVYPVIPELAREGQLVAWTGTELVVWGGDLSFPAASYVPVFDGYIYNPLAQGFPSTKSTVFYLYKKN